MHSGNIRRRNSIPLVIQCPRAPCHPCRHLAFAEMVFEWHRKREVEEKKKDSPITYTPSLTGNCQLQYGGFLSRLLLAREGIKCNLYFLSRTKHSPHTQ